MAKYSDIKGFTVQTLSSDTVANKYAGGAWTSGGNLPQVLYENAGAGATQTAALNFGGQGNSPGPAHPTSAETQTYNGSSWTEVNDLNTGRRLLGGAGTYTSAIAMGGYTQPPATDGTQFKVELWDGTNWTETTDLNTKGRYFQGFGVVNTAAVVANRNNGSSVTNKTETWNGSAWTEVAESNTNRSRYGAAGTSTAGVIAGGSTPAPSDTSTAVEQWNGSAWTEIAEINTGRNTLGGSGAYTDALMSGGDPGSSGKTERYDGSSWTELSDLSTGRYLTGSAGHTAADTGIVFGGEGRTASTEEFTAPALFSKQVEGQLFFNSTTNTFKETITDIPGGAWASSSSLNNSHGYGTGFGLQTAALSAFGGYPTVTTNTELYDGSSWTEVNNGNTARRNLASFGIYTSGLAFGGGSTPPFGSGLTESWNGTNWTEVSDIPAIVYDSRGIGTSSSAGLNIGGDPGQKSTVNEWNGSSWGSFTSINTGRAQLHTSNAGSVTAGLVWGGETPSLSALTEQYDGSSWTEVSDLNTARGNGGFNGISTLALCYGGNTPAPPSQSAICEFWNGTSWTEVGDLGNNLSGGIAPAGGAVSGLASGGQSAPSTQFTGTEEWTSSLANKTITAS